MATAPLPADSIDTPDRSSDEEDHSDEVYVYYNDRRHATQGSIIRNESEVPMPEWRMTERLKTVSVSLVLCLNIGVDPPDVLKTTPTATLECWVDPFSQPAQKALETIGRNLQQQYELWQPRARYRLSLDPSIEETKKLCCSLRRNAKDERILFHYNGHGVPKPTAGGELWVFNKNYTQYIPVSIYDLQTWLGAPCIFVYDCSHAGNILLAFNKFAEQRDAEAKRQQAAADTTRSAIAAPIPPHIPLSQCIQIAACGPNEILPMSPDLPADLLTSCLTTPIEIALRWIVLHNKLIQNVTTDMIMKIPGKLNDRRTPLGELNWIFTAITDTIAWNTLPPDVFQRLFRQDLMVAALFRNFLLADRLMRHYNCHPMSSPVLPPTNQHPIWDAWDLAADFCLSQLPDLLAPNQTVPVEYKHSTFFSEQLTAFEIWLKKANISSELPQQLPIVLQVLLSQHHRLRALMLLSKFLDIGQRAVNLALSVGIFPYVLKLLQSPAAELRPVLVFIWAKLLAVDPSCQADLLKDAGYTYFISILAMKDADLGAIANPSEHRAMCAFVLSVFCKNYLPGQQACLKSGIIAALKPYLTDHDSLLRQWICICLTQFWTGFAEAKAAAFKNDLDNLLENLLNDPVAEVRVAAVAAYGGLLSGMPQDEESACAILGRILMKIADASPMVRRELVVALSFTIHDNQIKYVRTAIDLIEEERVQYSSTIDERRFRRTDAGGPSTIMERLKTAETFKSPNQKSILSIVWKAILALSVDSFPDVRQLASRVVDKIILRVMNRGSMAERLGNGLVRRSDRNLVQTTLANNPHVFKSSSPNIPFRMSPSFSSIGPNVPSANSSQQSVKRSNSFVSSLRSIANMVGLAPRPEVENAPIPIQAPSRLSRPLSMINMPAPAGNKPTATSPPTINQAELETISLESEFYSWSCAYFKEPQMAVING